MPFQQALRVVLLRHVAYSGWRAGSTADAQDAVAEVFLTAWRRLDAVPDGDGARVWLYATARKVIANQRRSTRRNRALRERLEREAAPAWQVSPESDRDETLVHEALGRLGARDREVLLLAEWEGLSPAQIATVLGCAAVTARGRLHRARRRFRTVFEELGACVDGELPRRSARAVTAPPTMQLREGGS